MKKTLLKHCFSLLLLMLIVLYVATGCKSKKSIFEQDTNIKDSLRNELFESYKKEVNKKVADSIAKILPIIKTGDKNCDSICNEKCNELLEQANFYKQSGDNNYKLLFDKHKRLLSFTANLEETISEFQTKKEIKERHFVRTVKITTKVPVKFIPFWVQVLAWLGGIFCIKNIS